MKSRYSTFQSYQKQYRADTYEHLVFIELVLGACIAWQYPARIATIVPRLIAIELAVSAVVVIAVCVHTVTLRRKRMFGSLVNNMEGLTFERYVAGLLKDRGYRNVRLTEKYDYGVDIIAEHGGVRWGIQVKRYSDLVKMAAVQQVVAGLRKYRCDRAMVITNSTFSETAKELARHNDCVLIDGKALLRL